MSLVGVADPVGACLVVVTLRLRFEREIAWPFEKKNKMSKRWAAVSLAMLLDKA